MDFTANPFNRLLLHTAAIVQYTGDNLLRISLRILNKPSMLFEANVTQCMVSVSGHNDNTPIFSASDVTRDLRPTRRQPMVLSRRHYDFDILVVR